MKIIDIRPSKRFGGSWTSFEGDGVEPAYPDQEQALSYAKQRFGCASGEIHVYEGSGKTVVEVIKIDGRNLSRKVMPVGLGPEQ